ncbi:hypothetical protein BDZ45DRAFT_735639 [Acephala macrosclerotiorum]|nr:hypothetical protein BDZ45DRAFT_735639 [Acephala macrosclerotiorum]
MQDHYRDHPRDYHRGHLHIYGSHYNIGVGVQNRLLPPSSSSSLITFIGLSNIYLVILFLTNRTPPTNPFFAGLFTTSLAIASLGNPSLPLNGPLNLCLANPLSLEPPPHEAFASLTFINPSQAPINPRFSSKLTTILLPPSHSLVPNLHEGIEPQHQFAKHNSLFNSTNAEGRALLLKSNWVSQQTP